MDAGPRRDSRGVYKFGEFVLDVGERDLRWGTRPIHLAPKTFEVLIVLVTRACRLVTKREILDRVWPNVFGILTVHVAQLRRVLGEAKGTQRYIETVSGFGYRFRAVVQHSSTQSRMRLRRAHTIPRTPPPGCAWHARCGRSGVPMP